MNTKMMHLLVLFAFYFISGLLPTFAQPRPNPDIKTSGTGTWYPPPGCSSFYVQTWGGGAGGSSSYGGGGGSFSQTTNFPVTASSYTIGYP
jgi:hypothetical protein